jgi:hypothetical protein
VPLHRRQLLVAAGGALPALAGTGTETPTETGRNHLAHTRPVYLGETARELAVAVIGQPAAAVLFDLLRAGDAGEYFDTSVMVPGGDTFDAAGVYPDSEEMDLSTGVSDTTGDPWISGLHSMLRGLEP